MKNKLRSGTGFTMNADRIVSITAIVVAVGTLFIIIYQTHLIRKTQEASVLPYLQIGFSQNGDNATIKLTNFGVGPALIEEIHVLYQGQQYQGDPHDYLSQLNMLRPNTYVDLVLPGMLIPAGQTRTMLGVYSSEDKMDLMDKFNVIGNEESTNGAIIEITYSSVYGKKWTVRSNEIVPEPI